VGSDPLRVFIPWARFGFGWDKHFGFRLGLASAASSSPKLLGFAIPPCERDSPIHVRVSVRA
jgi:hypothetical protein